MKCPKCGKEADMSKYSFLYDMCHDCKHTCVKCGEKVEPSELWINPSFEFGHRECMVGDNK